MSMFAGLDVGGKRTAVCVVDERGKVIWQGMVDTHPEMIAAALKRLQGKLQRMRQDHDDENADRIAAGLRGQFLRFR